MRIRCKRLTAAIVLTLLQGVVASSQSWAQATNRIGTVLTVEGAAEVRAQDITQWERLRFRDAIFLNDTIRTGEGSKIKILLRDDSIMTLAEQSELQFTEFLLTDQQRRSVVNLLIGKIRVLTTRLFGAGSFTEVHTANAVAGVRGSEEHVQYDDTTEKTTMYCASGGGDSCYLLDPLDPTRVLNIPEGHLSEKVGLEPPLPPRPVTPSERQAIVQVTAALPAQVNTEVKTTEELKSEEPQPIRGAPEGTPPPEPVVIPGAGTEATAITPEAQAIQVVEEPRPATAVIESPQIETITPDVSPPAQEVIQKSLLNVIVNFPGR